MTVIASPPPVPSPFRRDNASVDLGESSNVRNTQWTAPIPRHPAGAAHTPHSSVNSQTVRDTSVSRRGLTNGHTTGADTAARGNNDLSPEQQELIRSRTDNLKLSHRPRAQLTRTQTDFGPHRQARLRPDTSEEVGELRHGWEDQYNSSEFLGLLSSVGFFSRHVVAS